MAYLRKKKVKGEEYYYLVHSFRVDGKHKKIERYIGKKEPSKEELEKLKIDMEADIQKDNWICINRKQYEIIEAIKKKETYMLDEDKLMDFCINFTYNTNAIEGSELSREETMRLLKDDISAKKSFKDEIESFSHRKVFMEMIESKEPLSLKLIKRWHKDMFFHSKPNDAGKFRKKNVRVAEYKAPHYMDIEILLFRFIDWYNENRKKMHPIELAALTHLKFVKIHPFLDGNGRIGRMLLNYVLHKNDYPMMTVEYKDRMSYYKALDKFDDTQEEEVFVQYVVESYINENNMPVS